MVDNLIEVIACHIRAELYGCAAIADTCGGTVGQDRLRRFTRARIDQLNGIILGSCSCCCLERNFFAYRHPAHNVTLRPVACPAAAAVHLLYCYAGGRHDFQKQAGRAFGDQLNRLRRHGVGNGDRPLVAGQNARCQFITGLTLQQCNRCDRRCNLRRGLKLCRYRDIALRHRESTNIAVSLIFGDSNALLLFVLHDPALQRVAAIGSSGQCNGLVGLRGHIGRTDRAACRRLSQRNAVPLCIRGLFLDSYRNLPRIPTRNRNGALNVRNGLQRLKRIHIYNGNLSENIILIQHRNGDFEFITLLHLTIHVGQRAAVFAQRYRCEALCTSGRTIIARHQENKGT